jgi:hypothetical protein
VNVARRISTSVRSLGPPVVGFLEDAALIGGACLVAYGVWLMSPPWGFVVGGALLMAGSILKARGTV